jgi:peptidylprolyl isomerase
MAFWNHSSSSRILRGRSQWLAGLGAGLLFCLLMVGTNPAMALPQGNAVTDPKALLRYSLPINNPTVRELQKSLEDVAAQLRGARRWGGVNGDLKNADLILIRKQDKILASIPEDKQAQAQTYMADIQTGITNLKTLAEAQNRQGVLDARKPVLDIVTNLEELMLPAEFPYEVPAEFSNLPQLKGRATIAITTTQGDMTAVVDGYSAPVSAGNFVDLVQRGFYNKMPFARAEDFYVLQSGDPVGPEEGFIDPKTKQYRAVPLEILVQGDKVPTYGITLEDAGRPLDQPVLPFSSYGAIAMARPNEEANGGSSQFFFFLFEPELTPAGINLLDGRYAIFGYVTENNRLLGKLGQEDQILSMKVTSGLENFVKPQ